MKTGYVYVPYILQQSISIISDSGFASSKMIKNRYSIMNIDDSYILKINHELLEKRRLKIDKILNKINESN